MSLTVGSLFSGIGGIDLGLERAGMRTRWFSEIDPYASRVLAKHWPDVPNHGDITKIDFTTVEPVDVLAGGFPCQDISVAGAQAGIKEDTRSGLWFKYAGAIRDIRPRYVLVENVAALLSVGMGIVLGELSTLGYDAWWSRFTAAEFGLPHRRDRIFILAYPSGQRWDLLHDPTSANGARRRIQNLVKPGYRWKRQDGGHSLERVGWSVIPEIRGSDDGVPARVDRLRGLGNAVVPQIPELIGGWIIDHARATGYLESAA